MKKFLTASLLFCMVLTCTFTTVFATDYRHEDKMKTVSSKKMEVVPYNKGKQSLL